MKRTGKRFGGTAILLSGSLLLTGCTGNAAGDGALVGGGAGLGTFLLAKAAGMKTGQAAALGVGVGVAAGVVTFFVADAKYKRAASDHENEVARERAAEVARRDAEKNKPRKDDYYVPVGRDDTKKEVYVEKIDHQTQKPTGEVTAIGIDDLNTAQKNGQTIKIDGHELAGTAG